MLVYDLQVKNTNFLFHAEIIMYWCLIEVRSLLGCSYDTRTNTTESLPQQKLLSTGTPSKPIHFKEEPFEPP